MNSCKNLFLAVCSALVIWAPNLVLADEPTNSSHTFFVNGVNYNLSSDLLNEIRLSWKGSANRPKTVLASEDANWVLDFIAVDQFTRAKKCTDLVFLNVAPGKKNGVDFVKGKAIYAGKLDEQWILIACGKRTGYRVFEYANGEKLGVYEIGLSRP